MLDWLTNVFSSGPKKKWIVELSSPGFITNARMREGASSDDLSHTIALDFDEPVREGNDVAYLNFRSEGQVIFQMKLYSGDTSHSFACNPYHESFEIVTVDLDDKVVSTETLTMEEMVVTDIAKNKS